MNTSECQQEGTLMKKTLIIECPELNFNQSFEVYLPYDCENREIQIGQTIHHLINQFLDSHQQFQMFYFNPRLEHFQYAGIFPFNLEIIIGQEFIQLSYITIRVRPLARQPVISQKSPKKKRGQERTIRQVLQKVSEWREIGLKNPKKSLEQAAKEVGIPRHTLDSYYTQIKLASQHSFDFKSNLSEKVGVLRRFVKQNNPRRKQSKQQDFIDEVLRQEDDNSQSEEEQEE